ncbi:MAG TPA: hypothetical protein VGM92_01240 [Candidatus Kapabacteria bacterium]|jgi:hypothetical protein
MKKTIALFLLLPSICLSQALRVGVTREALNDTIKHHSEWSVKSRTIGRIAKSTELTIAPYIMYETAGSMTITFHGDSTDAKTCSWQGTGFTRDDFNALLAQIQANKEYSFLGESYDKLTALFKENSLPASFGIGFDPSGVITTLEQSH